MINNSSETNNTLIVGLTGSIGSGKSVVASKLAELGAVIIDADILAREVVAKGSEGLEEVLNVFGEALRLKNGELNRKALGRIVFSDADKRKELERILHPKIRNLFSAKLESLLKKRPPPPMIVYSAALLFESGNVPTELEQVIVVSSPIDESLNRVAIRDGCTVDEARQRYEAQWPIERKEMLAEVVIRNTGTIDELRQKAEWLYRTLVPNV